MRIEDQRQPRREERKSWQEYDSGPEATLMKSIGQAKGQAKGNDKEAEGRQEEADTEPVSDRRRLAV
jgi:hypothetical protein